MTRSNDPRFVREQYATHTNLDARISLHQRFSTASQPFYDWLFDQVHLPENARVLEIGCGSGALWEHMRSRIPSAWRIILTDLSFGMTSTVQEKFRDSRFTFAQCDASALPFAGSSFDGVFANHMLYHVPDLARTLQEIRRVLKHDGTLYAATNGANHLRELDALVSEIAGQPRIARRPEDNFGLENGATLLAPYFAKVIRQEQENNLRVTQVEPLIAYVRSGWLYNAVAQDAAHLQEFRRRVQHEIETRGAFFITKSAGLFIARNE